jgi:very-short-patch-repair endonuclease
MQHQDVTSKTDGQRDLDLRRCGIETIRIPNHLLVRDSLQIELMIAAAVERRCAMSR